VKAYQLLNYTEFDANGRYVDKIISTTTEVIEIQETETAEA
jgi:hypothetical protein